MDKNKKLLLDKISDKLPVRKGEDGKIELDYKNKKDVEWFNEN